MIIARRLVSKKKRRIKADGFELDLSYVTPNVIATGFPAEGFQALFRNPFEKVFAFLEKRHHDQYKLYNLCSEREYEISKFHSRVERFGFDDHHAPAFELMGQCCESIRNWLLRNDENVAVVHCKAGKGRTGVMICCWMMYDGQWSAAEDSQLFYAAMRTYNMKGVTIPSQIRYINYFERSLAAGGTPEEYQKVKLTQVKFHTVPLKVKHGLFFNIFQMGELSKPLYTHEGGEGSLSAVQQLISAGTSGVLTWNISPELELQGDFLVQFYDGVAGGKKEKLCFLWVNSHYARAVTLVEKSLVDKAHKDKKNLLFLPEFKVELRFKNTTDATEGDAAPAPKSKRGKKGKKAAAAAESTADAASGEPAPANVVAPPLTEICRKLVAKEVFVVNEGPAASMEAFAKAHEKRGCRGADPCSVSAYLVKRVLDLYVRYRDPEGHVTLELLKDVAADAEFNELWNCLTVLKDVPVWPVKSDAEGAAQVEREKASFWINVYNLLSLLANAKVQPQSLRQRLALQLYIRMDVGSSQYSLAEILLWILRVQLPESVQFERLLREQVKWRKKKAEDPMGLHATKDPKITFAINAGVLDGPEIVPYLPETIARQLSHSARNYFRNRLTFDVKARRAFLPRIIDWVRDDFGRNRSERGVALGELMDPKLERAFHKCLDNPSGWQWSYGDQVTGFSWYARAPGTLRRGKRRSSKDKGAEEGVDAAPASHEKKKKHRKKHGKKAEVAEAEEQQPAAAAAAAAAEVEAVNEEAEAAPATKGKKKGKKGKGKKSSGKKKKAKASTSSDED